jgi:hypothetical protein
MSGVAQASFLNLKGRDSNQGPTDYELAIVVSVALGASEFSGRLHPSGLSDERRV